MTNYQLSKNHVYSVKSSIKKNTCHQTKVIPMANFIKLCYRRNGLLGGCFVGFFHLPKNEFPIEKMLYQQIGLLAIIKVCYERNRLTC